MAVMRIEDDHKESGTEETRLISCTSQKCAVVTKGPVVRSNDGIVTEGIYMQAVDHKGGLKSR